MRLLLIRIPLTLLFAYAMAKALVRRPELSGGDMVFLLGFALAGAVVMALVWAPVVGEGLSDTVTSSLTQETSLPPQVNRLAQSIGRLQRRRCHRLALLLVFVEGIRHPDQPQPALLGLRSVRPRSFLERCFAREVYRFNNIQNCLHAYKILTERHGVVPPLHQHPEVNLAIMNLNRQPPPEPATIPLRPGAPPARPARNSRIRLFGE
jgi:hypothetical protein